MQPLNRNLGDLLRNFGRLLTAKYAKISILSDWKDEIDMAEGKRRFKVQIDGEEFTIIGKSTPEHMNAVMEVANQELATIKKMMPSLSEKKAALLLAINAVSDQLEKQEELDKLQQKIEDQTN